MPGCGWCAHPVPAGRKRYCADLCMNRAAWKRWASQNRWKRQQYQRQRYLAKCGTLKLAAAYEALRK